MKPNTALLLIDIQLGLDDPRYGTRNNSEAERKIAELLEAWRRARRPVLHVQHMSPEPESALREGDPGNAFKPEALPSEGEPIFRKCVHSAFLGTDLEFHCRSHGIEELVVIGLTTDHCVSTTVRMACDLGFEVTVVEDATAAFGCDGSDGLHYTADTLHRAALASLHGEFATVRSTADVLAELQSRS